MIVNIGDVTKRGETAKSVVLSYALMGWPKVMMITCEEIMQCIFGEMK